MPRKRWNIFRAHGELLAISVEGPPTGVDGIEVMPVAEHEAEFRAAAQSERQRVRKLLEEMVERQELNSQDCGWVVPTTSIEAVLDSLEDDDG